MPEVQTAAQVLAARGSDINALLARQQYEQNVEQFRQQQIAQQQPSEQARIDAFSAAQIQRLRDLGITQLGSEARPAVEYLKQQGFSDAAINYAFQKYGPQFQVYGARSPGALYTKGGYEVVLPATGQKYLGTQEFLQSKIEAQPPVYKTEMGFFTTYAPKLKPVTEKAEVELPAGKSEILASPPTQEMPTIPQTETIWSFGPLKLQRTEGGLKKTEGMITWQDILFNPEYFKPIRFFVIPAKPIGTKQFTETFLAPAGTAGKVAGEFIPSTYFGAAATTAGAAIYPSLPSLARLGISGTTAYFGTKTALTPELPIEKRIAGGIAGGLGIIGTAIEATPYIRGVKSILSPEYKPVVKAEEGFKAIKLDETQIGLIPQGLLKGLELLQKFNCRQNRH